jgi:iron complex outermembrane receptor protein
MAEIAEGRYEAGIEELKRAYDILPHPNVLYNIARAYVDQGDLENAALYYRRYLEGNPKDRDEVAQILASLDARIRKQQAELLEAQRVQASPVPPGGSQGPARARRADPNENLAPPGAGTATAGPGAPTGPAPLAGRSAEHGVGASTPSGPSAPSAALPAGSLKTEEVFEETVVTASKTAQSPLDAPNSTSIITEQDIRLSGITKIPELLRRLAGVDLMEVTGSQTEVSLRGFNQRLSNKVLVLVNGRSVYVDLLGATFWGTLSIGVEDVERIEVVRGPGSALYGADAFNGVINIITKQPGEGGSGFNVGYGDHNTMHGSVYASGRSKDVAYRLSAGYDYLPRWSREVPDGRTDVSVYTNDQSASQRTARFDATVTRQIGSDVTIGLQGGYTGGLIEILGIATINDIVLGPMTSSDVTAFLNSKHFEVRVFFNSLQGTAGINSAYLDQSNLVGHLDEKVLDGEAQYIDSFSFGRRADNDFHVGAAYRLKAISWVFQAQDELENHAGFFLHDELKIATSFAIVGDYRADYVPYLDRVVQSPRASVLFHPTKRSTVRASVGTAFRTPTFLESYVGFAVPLPISAVSDIFNGQRPDNPAFRLNPEQIFTTELGYLSSDSDYFTVDSSFFYNHASNLIDVLPTQPLSVGDLANPRVPTAPDPQSGRYPAFMGGFENQCQQFDVYGAELGVRAFPLEGLDLYANGTLMEVKQDDKNCTAEELSLLAPDARTSAVKINTGVELRTPAGFDGSIDLHYVSPQDWAEKTIDAAKQRIDYQSFHIDQYTLLNASVGYRFPKNHAELRGVVFNLTNDQHREHPFGQYVGQRFMGLFSYRF